MDSDMMEDDESGEDFNDLDLDAQENMSAEIDSDEVDSDSDEGKAALQKVTDIRKKQHSKPVVEVSDDDSSDEEEQDLQALLKKSKPQSNKSQKTHES